MGVLTYTTIASLDGYVADADGDFSWAAPDEEVHRFVNDHERPVGTYLYGRRLYEVMAAWETLGEDKDDQPAIRDFASLWRAADKVVYSTTLTETQVAQTARTRLDHRFDPEEVHRLVERAGEDAVVSVGGAHLAAEALRAGLVDEMHLFVVPIVVGGGTRTLPDDVRIGLGLVDERRFASGVVYLEYVVQH